MLLHEIHHSITEITFLHIYSPFQPVQFQGYEMRFLLSERAPLAPGQDPRAPRRLVNREVTIPLPGIIDLMAESIVGRIRPEDRITIRSAVRGEALNLTQINIVRYSNGPKQAYNYGSANGENQTIVAPNGNQASVANGGAGSTALNNAAAGTITAAEDSFTPTQDAALLHYKSEGKKTWNEIALEFGKDVGDVKQHWGKIRPNGFQANNQQGGSGKNKNHGHANEGKKRDAVGEGEKKKGSNKNDKNDKKPGKKHERKAKANEVG
jgi:hypothetical protein